MKNNSRIRVIALITIAYLGLIFSSCSDNKTTGTSIETSTYSKTQVEQDLKDISQSLKTLNLTKALSSSIKPNPSANNLANRKKTTIYIQPAANNKCSDILLISEVNTDSLTFKEEIRFYNDTLKTKELFECQTATLDLFYAERNSLYITSSQTITSNFRETWVLQKLSLSLGAILTNNDGISIDFPYYRQKFYNNPTTDSVNTYMIFELLDNKYFGGFSAHISKDEQENLDFNDWMQSPIFDRDSTGSFGLLEMKYRGDSLRVYNANNELL